MADGDLHGLQDNEEDDTKKTKDETGDHGGDSCPGSETDAAAVAVQRNATMTPRAHGNENNGEQKEPEDKETGRDDTKKDLAEDNYEMKKTSTKITYELLSNDDTIL